MAGLSQSDTNRQPVLEQAVRGGLHQHEGGCDTMFTYAGRFCSSGARNEAPADDLETTKLCIEEVVCLSLLEFVGPLIVERIELNPLAGTAVRGWFTLDVVLHSPDHSTSLRRETLASARRRIDSMLRTPLTELLGRVRVVRSSLVYATCDAAWGEVQPHVSVEAQTSGAHTE